MKKLDGIKLKNDVEPLGDLTAHGTVHCDPGSGAQPWCSTCGGGVFN